MIKEPKKNTKYNFNKSKKQILLEYLRTIFASFIVAVFITTGLTLHVRNEMIKDIFANKQEQNFLDKNIALEIINQTNILDNLHTKPYTACMRAGEIFEIIGNHKEAQKAYELAIKKKKNGTYKPYYKLICVLVAQEKFDDAKAILNSIKDITDVKLIKFKSRSYITIGDKYYSIGKFLSAAKYYERANFYYNKFTKKDAAIEESIKNRIINSYIQVADIMVRSGKNSDAIIYLHKAEQYNPKDYKIRYKLAIVLSDTDPEKAIEYIEQLLKENPQDIDYGVYNTALMKAANIADLDGRHTQAKYYRYKIHSIDLFLNRKVIYKNDIETSLKSFCRKKVFFRYPLKATYQFSNISNTDIKNLRGDFVLCHNEKPVETVSTVIADKEKPLLTNSREPNTVTISFKKRIYSKKDLDFYKIKIYLYKDTKYKTYIGGNKIPKRSF